MATLTVSLASNGFAGTKLTPLPSGWASSFPVWAPLREPRTVTVPSASALPPRKEIVVFSPAVSVPGTGYTENAGVCACACARTRVVPPTRMVVAPSARDRFRTLPRNSRAVKKLRIVARGSP